MEEKLDPASIPLAPDGENVRPLTTKEEDKHSESQRRVNLIWELTQALIAIVITTTTVWAELHHVNSLLMGNAFVLIIALYFVRTNHTKTGGVDAGSKDSRS